MLGPSRFQHLLNLSCLHAICCNLCLYISSVGAICGQCVLVVHASLVLNRGGTFLTPTAMLPPPQAGSTVSICSSEATSYFTLTAGINGRLLFRTTVTKINEGWPLPVSKNI